MIVLYFPLKVILCTNSKDNLNLLVSSIEKFVGAHMENFLNVKVMQSETLQFEKIGTVTLYNCLI